MKRKVKSLVATIVCLAMTIVMLSACTSNGSTGNNETQKPTSTETPTATVEPDQQNSTTDPVTTDPTESPTATAEPQQGEVIIPLFPEENREQIYQMDPIELLKFSNFYQMFNIHGSGKIDYVVDGLAGGELELLTNDYFNNSYEISAPPSDSSSTTHPTTIYVSQSMNNQITNDPNSPVVLVFYIDGAKVGASMGNFVPLYYNETRHCFVGYLIDFNESTGEAEGFRLVEKYYNGNYWPVVDVADPSLYGF